MAHQLDTNTSTLRSVLAQINSFPNIATPLAELNAANGGTAATTIGAAVDNTEVHASSQEALIAQIAEALEGKAGGGGSSGGASVEYEIVTIPAGSTSANYSLSRVTAAYGSISGSSVQELAVDNGWLCVRNNLIYYIAYIDEGRNGDYVVETNSTTITYSNGVMRINAGSPSMLNELEVILVNDPSAIAISV